jgi:hypothetical protein
MRRPQQGFEDPPDVLVTQDPQDEGSVAPASLRYVGRKRGRPGRVVCGVEQDGNAIHLEVLKSPGPFHG